MFGKFEIIREKYFYVASVSDKMFYIKIDEPLVINYEKMAKTSSRIVFKSLDIVTHKKNASKNNFNVIWKIISNYCAPVLLNS